MRLDYNCHMCMLKKLLIGRLIMIEHFYSYGLISLSCQLESQKDFSLESVLI